MARRSEAAFQRSQGRSHFERLRHRERDSPGPRRGRCQEIPCVQALIRELRLAGVLYTGDGMQCQKKTFEAAEETGSYVLAQVKANQPTLLDTLQEIAATKPSTDHHETKDKIAHGRQERRVVDIFAVGDRLAADWDGLIAALG